MGDTKAMTLYSLSVAPLGAGDGEANLQTPFNTTAAMVRVRIRNWSAHVPRRLTKTPVSWMHGGDAAVREKKYHDAGYSMETIQQYARTRDMTVYEDKIKPQAASLTFDGEYWVAPPSATPELEPEWVDVPEGMWDLYCGNFDRMHSNDMLERNQEATILASRWGNRRNCVAVMNPETGRPNTNEATGGNPFGFIEFSREVIVPVASAIDREAVVAGQLIEV